MRIAQISTMASPVRPRDSHSVEQVVWLLSDELVRMGHDVTVFGCAGAETAANFETSTGAYAQNGGLSDWHLCEWANLSEAVSRSGDFDVIHSHVYLWGIPLEVFSAVPMLHTLHVQPFADEAILRQRFPQSRVTALSRAQWSDFPELPTLPVVHHGVDARQFTPWMNPEHYVLFLGRLVPGKGVLQAIDAASAGGITLKIAGEPTDYFREQVAPRVDGTRVMYVGPVTGEAQNTLIASARGLVYPIERPEPFGLVLIEAMSCGTPVAGMSLGAVPELVTDGIDGCLAADADGLADALRRAMCLDRRRVFESAAARFSASRMACGYLRLYEQAVKGAACAC